MKRNAEIYSKDLFQLPSSSTSRSNEFGKSKKWSGSRVSRASKDISRVKRVRFADSNTVYPVSYRPDASSKHAKRTNPPRADDPKTSEYAFFTKLKEDAGQNLHSYQLHKRDNQLKKFETSYSIGEMTNIVKHNSEELKSLFLVEKFTPIDLKSTISPLGVPENSGVHYRSRHRHEEVFSKKRQNLRQWVANASSPEVDDCCSKGYDLISVLLQRLVPESNESNSRMDPRSRHMDLNTKSLFLSSSDINFKELPWNPKRNFMAPMPVQYLEGSSLACRSSGSGESILSEWDRVGSEPFSIGYANKDHMQYKIRDPDRVSYGGRPTSLRSNSESNFGIDLGTELAFEKYGSLALGHMPTPSKLDISDYENLYSHWHSPQHSLGLSTKSSCEELDELHDPNEPALGKERCTLLLDWDDNNMQNEPKLSIASQNAVLNLDPTSSTSWGDDHCLRRDNKFDSSGLGSSSFLAIYHPSLGHMPMTSKLDWSDHENLFPHRHSIQQSLGPSSNSSYKELDEFHVPNESSLGRELCTPLLDRDDNNMQSELKLSNSFHSTVLNFDSTLPTSWGDDHCRSLDSKFDASGFCSSSSLAIHHSPVFTSLWDFSSESYPNQAVGRQALEDKNYLVAGLNFFPLSSPCTPNYLALADGYNFSNSYGGSSLFGSPHNHHAFNQVFREKHHPTLDSLLLSSGLDYGFGWKGLSIIHSSGECHSSTYPDLQFPANEIQGISSYQLTGDKTQTHIAEDGPNNNSLSSFSFQISLNKEWTSPLPFDKSSCDGPEGKICFGDCEDKYN